MGVEDYRSRGRRFWKVDEWLPVPGCPPVRFRQKKIPTKEQALALVAKKRIEAFEGKFFDRRHESKLTIAELWDRYLPAAKAERPSLTTEAYRGEHLKRHLGDRLAAHVTVEDIGTYRAKRAEEDSRLGRPPSVASVNREVALLRRMLNWAVKAKLLLQSPLVGVQLAPEDNVRRSTVDEVTFTRLLAAAEPALRPILLMAYDTGMRRGEILHLKRPQLDLRGRTIRLEAADTKTREPRVVVLTERLVEELKKLPSDIRSPFVFVNPATGTAWNDIRKVWRRACTKAGVKGLWFHDLRRSFVTKARRRGIPESVVMRMSGHRTRSVFERYNVIEEDDLREATRKLEIGAQAELGQELDTVGEGEG